MRRSVACALLLLVWASIAQAQIVGAPSQSLTATTNVATIPMAGVPSVSITVSGTWTGTLSFQFVTPPSTGCNGTLSAVDVAPITAGARVSTTTTNGTWVLDNAGFLTACVYANAISSGTATITAVRGFRSPASVITIGDAPSSANRVPTVADINNGGSVTARNNAIVEGGKAADDDASALFPLLIGGYASTAVPTAMSADGDAVKAWYDRNGRARTLTLPDQRVTYVAALTAKTATAAGTGPFFSLCGSSTTTLRVQKFVVSGTVATAAVYGDVTLRKTSTATSAGTPTALVKVPLDSGDAVSTANLANYYTALGTAGALVGTVGSKGAVFPLTGTVAAQQALLEWDWTQRSESRAPVLRGTAQCLEAGFGTTTTNAPTLQVEVTYTEE